MLCYFQSIALKYKELGLKSLRQGGKIGKDFWEIWLLSNSAVLQSCWERLAFIFSSLHFPLWQWYGRLGCSIFQTQISMEPEYTYLQHLSIFSSCCFNPHSAIPVIFCSSYCFILGKNTLLSRWSELFSPKSSLLHKLLCSLSSLFPSYLGFGAVPYLDVTLSLVMPHLFIILFLQGTDSFSLFKYDLLTFPLPCNLEIVWVVLSMKDTECQIITPYYSLRCQRPVRKLYLTCHYFCWPFCMLTALG